MSSLLGKKKLHPRKKPLWWLGAMISCAVGALLYMAASNSIEHDSRERFKELTRTAQINLSARIQSYANVLRGTAGLFQSSDHISREQFHRYVSNLSLDENFPAIGNINFARFLLDAERPAFEAQMQRDYPPGQDDYPAFAIEPPGRRPSYSVLVYLAPIRNMPEKYGVDIAARPLIAKVLEESRDSGRFSNSGQPVPMKSQPNLTGLAMRLPIYRAGAPVGNVAERRAAYLGSVGIGFDIADLVRGALNEMPIRHVRLALFDLGTESAPKPPPQRHDVPLFDSQQGPGGTPWWQPLQASNQLSSTVRIDYNGRIWQAYFSTRKSALYTRFDAYLPWLAMLAGCISTMLLYALYQTLSSARMHAVDIASAMTKELRESQVRLQMSHQKLRRLAAHADKIKEEERKRIAREIHDDLGQNLLVLRIDADLLASRTNKRHPRLNARARSTLDQIDATIKSVRHIINDLRPNVLDLGLNAAVEWQIAEFRRRTGIVCELNENQSDIRLNDQCATAFFRILQESLSNISQHAKASLVQVILQKDSDMLSMEVKDNGIGALIDGRNKVGSFGLVGIEERIKLLGGKFFIKSSPGCGMTVHVSVPIKAEAAAYPYLGEVIDNDHDAVLP